MEFRRYTFRSRCDEKQSLVLPNRSVEIFFNIHGTIGEESTDMLSLFEYMSIGRKQGEFVTAIDEEVRRIKADKEQKEAYMSLTAYIEDKQDESYDAGFTDGKDEGIRSVAKRLLQRGLSLNDIAEVTGLSVDELRQLQQQKA